MPPNNDSPGLTERLPTHLDLPDHDGENVVNGFEGPQTSILMDCLRPYLSTVIHPDGNFFLGGDVGFYWRLTASPLEGCKSPDFSYVPGVPPTLDGEYRRSYVMWQEHVSPTLLIEFVSSDGSEERDTAPQTGKFWVYEQGIRAQYYAIFEPDRELLEVYELISGRYRQLAPNSRGRFPISSIGLELGLWVGELAQLNRSFVRFFDFNGVMLPSPAETVEIREEQLRNQRRRTREERKRANDERERAEEEKARAEAQAMRAEAEKARAEAEKTRADKLTERLRALGIDPDLV